MIRRLAPFALLIAAPSTWLACNAILGIDEPELRPPSSPPVDTDPTDTGPGDAGCAKTTWPAPPSSDEPSDGGDASHETSFVVAARSLGFGLDPSLSPIGFDLDGTCTCPERESCVPRGDAGAHCDDPGGLDLSLNKAVLAVIKEAPGFNEENLNDGLSRGRFGVLVEVSGYNGGPNDRQVEVAMFLSSGTSGDATPTWTADDRWDLDPSSLASDAGPPRSVYVDKTAYVRDFVLVASRLQGAKLALGEGANAFELDLGQTVLAARIVRESDGAFALEGGNIAARWPTQNVLKAIAPLNDPFDAGPICKSPLVYKLAKSTICAAADLSTNPLRDRTGADCDAISLGLRFRASPASFGVVRPKPVPIDTCPGFVDDCNR